MAGFLDTLGKIGSAISPVGNVLSGIGSVVGAISGAKSARDAQREANETNIMLARENNALQYKMAQENNWLQQALLRENNQFNRQQAIDMFMMENYYNSPVQQMERLRKAGLNPAVMMEGAGGSATGNADGSTPSAATAGITPQLPSLTTPHVEPLPTMATGFLSALQQLSQIKLTNAQAKKSGAETNRIDTMLDQEFANMQADTDLKKSQKQYQDTMTEIQRVFGKSKALADIQESYSRYTLNMLKGDTEKAQKDLLAIEKEFKDTQNKQLIEQAPFLLENIKKTGQFIDEQKRTEMSKQSANYAAASAANAQAEKTREETRITRAEARIIEANEDDIIFARRLANANEFQDLGEKASTWLYRFEELKNRRLISEEQLNEAREAVEKAKKENSVYYWNFALSVVERINNGANKWAPWALSRSDGSPSPGEGMMYQSWQSTSTR